MKHLFFLVAFFLNISFLRAQISEDKLFFDTLMSTGSTTMIHTADQGTAMCGDRVGPFQSYVPQQGHIIKLDASSHFQWAKGYTKGLSSSDLTLIDMIQLYDGGYLALGHIEDSINQALYGYSMVIMRTDSSGDLLYVKSIADSTVLYMNKAACLGAITDSTFYIGMNVSGNIGSAGICKIDINGSVLKSTYISAESFNHTATLVSITRLMNGQYFVAISDDVPWASANRINFYFLDDDLNVLFFKSYYAPLQTIFINRILQSADSSIWAFGQIQISNDYPTPFAMKLDQQAALMWTNRYLPSVNLPMDFRTGIGWNNTFLAAGTNGYSVDYVPYILQLDSSGAILNSQTFTHTGQPYFIHQLEKLQDTLFVLLRSRLPGLNYGCGLAMMDSTLTLPCSADDLFFTVTADTLTSDSLINISTGTILSTDVTPQYQVISFILNEAQLCPVNSIIQAETENEISVYPNPSAGNFSISFSKMIHSGTIKICNVIGKTVKQKNISGGNQFHFELENISPGIYFMNVFDGENNFCKKIIIE